MLWAHEEAEPVSLKTDVRAARLEAVDGPLIAICHNSKDVLRPYISYDEQCSVLIANVWNLPAVCCQTNTCMWLGQDGARGGKHQQCWQPKVMVLMRVLTRLRLRLGLPGMAHASLVVASALSIKALICASTWPWYSGVRTLQPLTTVITTPPCAI